MNLNYIEIVQIITTGIVILIYAVLQSLQEGEADYLSNKYTLILCDFVIKYHPEFNSFQLLTNSNDRITNDNTYQIYYLYKYYLNFSKSGSFPSKELAANTNIKEHLWGFLLAPIVSFYLFYSEISESSKYHFYKIIYTELRKNYFSKAVIFLVPTLLLFLLGIYTYNSKSMALGIVLILISAISILCSLFEMIYLVREQIRWKDFWRETVLDITGIAATSENHDLFNRALILKNQIDSEPDLPIPATLAFYGAIISVINFIIPWLMNEFIPQ